MGNARIQVQDSFQQDIAIRNITVQFTRLANATTYAVGDLINDNSSTAFEFAGIAPTGQPNISIIVPKVEIFTNNALSLTVQGDLYLFSTPPTFTTDNGALSLNAAENRTILQRIPVGSGRANAASAIITTDPEAYIPQAFQIGASTSIFGLIRAGNRYVPGSAEVIDIRLHWIRV